MNNTQCSIVRDLLPLFVEGMLSDETADFVRNHLSECADCRSALDRIQQTDEPMVAAEVIPLRQLRRRISARRWQSVLLSVLLMAALFTSALAQLTERQFFAYSPALFETIEADGGVILSFASDVSCVQQTYGYDGEEECLIYFVEAWTTPLDQLLRRNSAQQLYIPLDDYSVLIFYTPNTGAEAIPVYSHNFKPVDELDWGVISCPRTALGMYFVIACAATLALLVLVLLLRRRPVARALTHLTRIPVAFALSILMVKGFAMTSYSMERDFSYICIVAALLFIALELLAALLRERIAIAGTDKA